MCKIFKLELISDVSSCFLRSSLMNLSVNTRWSNGQQTEPDRLTPYALKIHVSAYIIVRTNVSAVWNARVQLLLCSVCAVHDVIRRHRLLS
jgi:hypothetical protein